MNRDNDISLKWYYSLAAILLLWSALYWSAIYSAVKIWYISEIFTHGFFVFPASLYLIWRARYQLLHTPVKCNPWFFIPLVMVCLLGIAGFAGKIQVFTHTAAFASLPVIVCLIFGLTFARTLWFPLLFILFCIPIGDQLVPSLQQITADIAMVFLSLTDIPVFRTGLYIEIPSGKFVVAEACSGIRFFIGSLVFGAIYAYVSYRSWWRRGAFMVLAITMPIVANAVRVFGIILVGHYSNMEHATGFDHIVYGWVFFSIVLVILVVIGESFRQKPLLVDLPKDSIHPSWSLEPSPRIIIPAIVLFVLFLGWQYKVTHIQSADSALLPLTAQNLIDEETKPEGWKPHFEGASDESLGKLTGTQESYVYVAWYPSNTDSSELISGKNHFYDKNLWSLVSSSTVHYESLSLNAKKLNITSANGYQRQILYWYQLADGSAAGEMQGKLMQIWDIMSGGSGAGYIVAVMSADDPDEKDISALMKALIF